MLFFSVKAVILLFSNLKPGRPPGGFPKLYFSLKFCGPRHTPNPSTLRTFCHQKITHKELLTFSEKFYEHFKIILQHLLKLFRRHYPWKKLPATGDIPKNYVITNLKSVIFTLISCGHISTTF